MKDLKIAKTYLIYLIRWQLSTPILAIVMYVMGDGSNEWVKSLVANLIGGLIFFWVDRCIFDNSNSEEKENEDSNA